MFAYNPPAHEDDGGERQVRSPCNHSPDQPVEIEDAHPESKNIEVVSEKLVKFFSDKYPNPATTRTELLVGIQHRLHCQGVGRARVAMIALFKLWGLGKDVPQEKRDRLLTVIEESTHHKLSATEAFEMGVKAAYLGLVESELTERSVPSAVSLEHSVADVVATRVMEDGDPARWKPDLVRAAKLLRTGTVTSDRNAAVVVEAQKQEQQEKDAA